MTHPEWKLVDWRWRFLACNKNGDVFLYEHKPYKNIHDGVWMIKKGRCLKLGFDLHLAERWEQSLSSRAAEWHAHRNGERK
jgi:hypothetical protein